MRRILAEIIFLFVRLYSPKAPAKQKPRAEADHLRLEFARA